MTVSKRQAKKLAAIKKIKEELPDLILAAEDGDILAMVNLAALLATGNDYVAKNEKGAVYWYAQAILAGHITSKWNLGTMLLNGEGVEKNTRYGIELIESAAEEGESTACLFLSHIYKDGNDDIQPDKQKYKYFSARYREIEKMIPEIIKGKATDVIGDLKLGIEKPVISTNA